MDVDSRNRHAGTEVVSDDLNAIRHHSDPLIVGIDGHSGSGKTTLAEALRGIGAVDFIVHVDDFHRQPPLGSWPPPANAPTGHEFEFDRLEDEVLRPLKYGHPGTFTRRDFHTGQPKQRLSLPHNGIVAVEGIYSLQRQLRSYYEYTIWVETPLETCLSRMICRDGGETREKFEAVWFRQELRYVEEHRPKNYATRIVASAAEDLRRSK